ncbi:MAG: haloacid dehalogenase type II [Streptosporangiaceae bacterium]
MAVPALAFDMFGTLADPASYAAALRGAVDRPEALSRSWRLHQLEISWLVSLAGRYEDWTRVTGYALEAALAEADVGLSAAVRGAVVARAAVPDLFEDVPEALGRLRAAGMVLAVFSNGTRGGLEDIVGRHGLDGYFDEVISCDEVGVYKPAAAAYRHAADRLGLAIDRAWLVSGNPFDCAGAALAGMRVAKVDRGSSLTYSFAPPPDVEVRRFTDLLDALPIQ